MQREQFFPTFFIFLFCSIIIIFLVAVGFLNPLVNGLNNIITPIQKGTFHMFNSSSDDSKVAQLEKENQMLIKKLVDLDKLQKENSALRDQFETTYPKSLSLLPAEVIGAPGFLPGFSVPSQFIIDKGTDEGISTGLAVVVQNNLIGKITKTSSTRSQVTLLGNQAVVITAKDQNTQAVGIVKGQDSGEILLDNVLLSDTLSKDDFIITKGDIDAKGAGLPADLVIGKVTAIDKKPSNLFQTAKIKSLINPANLRTVFIVLPK
ncbi:MAG TPA: rod shape-determining protein MreC [Candidatus Saccharimonadales bacterium]|nr:rod shape-determining protein MreC [Candidatus Saccharimonadales bacterium]